jgi:predicted RNA-binding Zn-ribbon protein involved in translation (DUF1610 family)
MPIKMNCPSCGKTLSAPDTAAGKQAKCPACATMMLVPTGVFDAEEIAPGSPPPPESNLMGDVPATAPSQPPADPAAQRQAPQRRPCPTCGELIIATAAKCRFCGAIFDARLCGSSSRQHGQSYHGFAVTSLVLGILALPTACFGIVFGIVAIIFSAIASNGMKKSRNFEGKGMATAGMVMGIIGAVGWTIIYVLIFMFVLPMSHRL